MKQYENTLGQAIFDELENNAYLKEIYENILYNYGARLFANSQDEIVIDMPIEIEDALRFADLLSNSTHPTKSDAHKIMAQEMVALLQEMYPEDAKISYYLSGVLSNIGNYRGLSLTKNKEVANQQSFMDRLCQQYDMDKMRIPADGEKQFFRSQAKVYEHLSDQYFSYSGPTSMGKSFIMRMFIKQQILEKKRENYAIIVPTKALINEVSNKIIKDDLREMLEEYNYRVVTAGGDIALKQAHNFIFVMTPERFLYYLIDNPMESVEYLFVDEAHKISSKDDRSSFYYKILEMLSERGRKPHIIFASPNIPNPEIYLQLISDEECTTAKGMASTYSPVSQMKYIVNYETREVHLFNSQKKETTFIRNLKSNENLTSLLNTVGKESQNIVFCSAIGQAVAMALEYADSLQEQKNEDLEKISKEIQQEVHTEYYLAEIIKKGVAYHIGYLPTTIRLRIEELYRQGLIKTLFCTSTLVEGVNLPADNLFVTNYKIGRAGMGAVDFKNLVGRVGRIEFNLYGNVFLICNEKVKEEKYVELLKTETPEQKLSLVSGLTKPQKKEIIESLLKGQVEIPRHPKNQTNDSYALMRKFSILLLNDIMKDKNSRVKKEFSDLLNPLTIAQIKENFQREQNTLDDDINVSVDQARNLQNAVNQNLSYPRLTGDTSTDYDNLVQFLEQLCRIYKWEQYEAGTLGHRNKETGSHGMLRWYAVILLQWVNGYGLSYIIERALDYKRNTHGSKVKDRDGFTYVEYNDSIEHRNAVMAEVLDVIENIVTFRISNYFLKFSNACKQRDHVEELNNDWYEYVEYGTTNQISILLQKCGFTRETSRYIKENKDTYIVIDANNTMRIRRTLQDCDRESVRQEAEKVIYNMPEMFV